METMLIGLLIVGGGVLLSFAGLVVVRRILPLDFLKTHHEVAGFFIGVLGTIFAVLLAFVVFAVWGEFEDAKIIVIREANQLGDLSRLARSFPEPVQSRVRAELVAYTQVVVNEEWPAMSHGQDSQRAWKEFHSLWDAYREIVPQTRRDAAVYAESLKVLTNLSDSRRLRLHASRDTVPPVIWVLLWGGAVATICFTYFFGVKSLWSQVLMTGALAAVIGFILFLIVTLNNPFSGYGHVTPEPLQLELERIRAGLSE